MIIDSMHRIGISVVVALATATIATAQTTDVAPPKFSAAEQTARQAVLDGDAWGRAFQQFEAWISKQTLYDDSEIAKLEANLDERIATMSADELKKFRDEMAARLKVLNGPDVARARDWVAQYYNRKTQRRIAKDFGVDQPLELSADQLKQALQEFEAERAARRSAHAAFNAARESQVRAAQDFRSGEQTARKDALTSQRARGPSKFGSRYSPQRQNRPQSYRQPYRPMNYSIGPWGGVWVHRN